MSDEEDVCQDRLWKMKSALIKKVTVVCVLQHQVLKPVSWFCVALGRPVRGGHRGASSGVSGVPFRLLQPPHETGTSYVWNSEIHFFFMVIIFLPYVF